MHLHKQAPHKAFTGSLWKTNGEFKNFLNDGINVPTDPVEEIIRILRTLPNDKIIEFRKMLEEFSK